MIANVSTALFTVAKSRFQFQILLPALDIVRRSRAPSGRHNVWTRDRLCALVRVEMGIPSKTHEGKACLSKHPRMATL
jgi:hypothetical protein